MTNTRQTTRRRKTSSRRRTSSRSRSSRRGSVGIRLPFLHIHLSRAAIFGGLAGIVVYVWAFYYFFVGPTGFRWRALYGDDKYPEGYEVHGIDISHYQGTINWDRLRSNAMVDGCPIRFIIIKSTEGSSRIDPNFDENFYQAREYGFIRGVYHFVEDFQTDILTWLHIVENKYGVKPIIYTYYKFKDAYLSAPVFDDYPYWIAHYYVDKVEYQGKWKFWQHTDVGKLPGIKGHVDLNIYNGSYYDLMRLTIGNQENVVVAE